VVVLMIPLLFEAGLEELCSEVWLVDCDEAQQLQRLIARNGLSDGEARDRIAAQWPLTRKRELADRLIDNRGDRAALTAAALPIATSGTSRRSPASSTCRTAWRAPWICGLTRNITPPRAEFARFPRKRAHFLLKHVLIEKVAQLFRDMLYCVNVFRTRRERSM